MNELQSSGGAMTRDLILIAVDRATGEVMSGKEVIGQIGPVTPSITRIVKAMDIWAHTLGTPATRYARLYEYLANEGVDLSGAEVKPELWAVFDDEGLPDHLTIDKQMALDHIKHALQLASDSGDTESARYIAKYKVRPVVALDAITAQMKGEA